MCSFLVKVLGVQSDNSCEAKVGTFDLFAAALNGKLGNQIGAEPRKGRWN
jgi:hypothetical protein